MATTRIELVDHENDGVGYPGGTVLDIEYEVSEYRDEQEFPTHGYILFPLATTCDSSGLPRRGLTEDVRIWVDVEDVLPRDVVNDSIKADLGWPEGAR